MDATNAEDLSRYRSVMINRWEDPKKKLTMSTEDIEDEASEETTTDDRPTPPTPKKKLEEIDFEKTMREFVVAQRSSNEFVRNQLFNLKTKIEQGLKNHQAAIQDLETKFGRLADQYSIRPTGSLPSNTQTNLKPSSSNDKPYRPPPARNEHVNAIFTSSKKSYDQPENPNDRNTIIYDDSKDEADEAKERKNRKEKMEGCYAKFIDMIKEVRINVPLVDVLAGMLNYGKILKDLVRNKNFVILEMEEDNKVPLILGRPFLHIADAIIKVKNKELNLGVGDDRITFLIDKAMQHSYSNDDICFCMDVIDEVMEEELDALLNDSEPFLKIPEQEEEINDNFKELPLEENLRIKTSIQEPPTDLELKPLLEHLEYAFLEKDYLLPVVISALLEDDKKKRLVYVLKKHKEAFAWKTSDIPEFDIEIKNKKGAKNVAADHLSRLENPNLEELRDEDIDDNFSDKTFMNVSTDEEIPWFTDFANYLVRRILRKGLTYA
ncbi:hypothetical protein Tco_0128455 [Tanacetum coccineum]